MERSQIHRVSAADQAASILWQRILNRELRPGTPVQEVPLAASLGVSRNPMREAARILSLENLLKPSIHRGAAVSQLSLKVMNGEMPKKQRNRTSEKASVSRGAQTASRRRV